MRKNYFKRYVWLLDLLQRKGPLTLADIQANWRNSVLNETGESMAVRTFHNNRDSISEMFGIDIECDLSTSKYYISNWDDMEKSRFKHWMLDVLALNNLLDEYSTIRQQIHFENTPSVINNLEVVFRAIKDQVSITMDYQGASMSEPLNIEIEPWSLRLFKQRWYLIGYSKYVNDERLYMLERAQNIKLTTEKYVLPDISNVENSNNRYYGVRPPRNRKVENIKLKVSAKQRLFLNQLPIHESQKEIEHHEDYSIYCYSLIPNYDLKQEILSYGAEVEVIEPIKLRKEIIGSLLSTLSKYKQS